MTNPDLGGFVGYVPLLRSIKIKGIVLPAKLVYQRRKKKWQVLWRQKNGWGSPGHHRGARACTLCHRGGQEHTACLPTSAARGAGTGAAVMLGSTALPRFAGRFQRAVRDPSITPRQPFVHPSVRRRVMMQCSTGSPGLFPAGGWPPLAFPAPLPAVGEWPRGTFAPRPGAAWRRG